MENKEIENFLGRVTANLNVHKEFRQSYDEYIAFGFNPLSFFNIGENKVSEILAFFFNPEQSHGQKDKFLDVFTTHLKLDRNYGKLLNIEVEHSTLDKRRIDILLEFENINIGIENKLWAVDQHLQIQDYFNYLRSKTLKDNVLIYLTPDGKRPRSYSISDDNFDAYTKQGKLICMSYQADIIPMVAHWEQIANAPTVKSFLYLFQQFLTNKFFPSKFLIMDNNIKRMIRDNMETAATVFNIFSTMEAEAKTSIDKLAEKIKQVKFESFKGDRKFYKHWSENGYRYFRYDLVHGENYIVLEIAAKGLNIELVNWFPDTNPTLFKEFCEANNFAQLKTSFEPEQSDEILKLFIDITNKAIDLLNQYASK